MKKILIVDDDADILDAIQLILTTNGYDAEIAIKGGEIYQKIKDYKPNLIILDVLLSGNDGRTICKNLKKSAPTKHIPIIMISAHPTARNSVKECGADSFIPKPFSVIELLDEVKKYIGEAS